MIWSIIEPKKISKTVSDILANQHVLVSQVSLFEIAIKQKIGKLPALNIPIEKLVSIIKEDGFDILQIKDEHIANYSNIPLFDNHRYPFDRLILATTYFENTPIISSDEKFRLYQDMVHLIEN